MPWTINRSLWPWPEPPARPVSKAGPELRDRRPCGCRMDPAVFGHDPLYCAIGKAPDDAA